VDGKEGKERGLKGSYLLRKGREMRGEERKGRGKGVARGSCFKVLGRTPLSRNFIRDKS